MGIEIHHFLFYLDEVFLRTELVLLMRGVAVWRINHVYEITWIIKSFKQSTWLLIELCDCHVVGRRNFPNGLEENSPFFLAGGKGALSNWKWEWSGGSIILYKTLIVFSCTSFWGMMSIMWWLIQPFLAFKSKRSTKKGKMYGQQITNVGEAVFVKHVKFCYLEWNLIKLLCCCRPNTTFLG